MSLLPGALVHSMSNCSPEMPPQQPNYRSQLPVTSYQLPAAGQLSSTLSASINSLIEGSPRLTAITGELVKPPSREACEVSVLGASQQVKKNKSHT
jgi:hypothetical protein